VEVNCETGIRLGVEEGFCDKMDMVGVRDICGVNCGLDVGDRVGELDGVCDMIDVVGVRVFCGVGSAGD
jgi:hypothetical protein